MNILQNYCHSKNKVNLPSYLIACKEYNNFIDIDSELKIDGVIEYHRDLFNRILECESLHESAEIFDRYMKELFHLNEKIKNKPVNSYIKILRGWLFDSNRPEGAVLKGWVESRFGLIPTFHKGKITSLDCENYLRYLQERMKSEVSSNLIDHQFDLLYTYTQYCIKNFFRKYIPYITLYRGVNKIEEYEILEKKNNSYTLLINNISSFSLSREIAETFGDFIIEIKVPFTKIVFFQDVLPILKFSGEMEIIVIGGIYNAKISYF
ncbi:MAG: NAD(+)--dinitrogen-reductase ADP-D-ribosyltransferase [Calditerrivibrio sp.]|nr:NAD(+)--dinitrogen-reductase ADP-D-ribosyltransferase [Calditerrivibrio sp.]